MAANQTINNNSIRAILDKEKLNGRNFLDWYRNLRIVLMNEQKLHHLEKALPEAPPVTATAVVRNAYTRRVAEQQKYLQQAEQELFETVKAFHACKQEEGQSVSTYFMQNYNMYGLGKTIPELHAMLKLVEKSIPKKAPAVLAIRQGLIVSSLSQDCTLEEDMSSLFGRVDEEQSQHVWHIRLRGIRKMSKGALDLYVGNGNRAAIKVI
ncbi:hypothetical protein Tco_1373446 [Tanacetum coccineum]